ncbi:MAG TPA: histidine phosphatase family protein [Clostridia bacterium]|nr:histidine phosphatase family protein [Clostridia bacterium]
MWNDFFCYNKNESEVDIRGMTQVFLIRHSEQLKIKSNIIISETSQISNEKIILSIEGEKKAEEISNLDILKNIDELWASNYVRAISTAKYIADKNNININIDESFNERKLRKFRKFKRIRKK